MATLRWATRVDEETVLSTELNSLGNGSTKLSAALGHTNREMYADFELSIAATSSRTASDVGLYILAELDGTNYQYGSDSLEPSANAFRGSFLFDTGQTAARVDIITGVLLPPGNFKVLVKNSLGVALAASGNTLTMRRYNTESV